MKQRQRKRNRRIKALGAFVLLLMAGLLGRIIHISVVYGADFERYSVRQVVRRQNSVERIIPPAHGGILDRNRQPLVDSERVFHVALDVNVLHSLETTRRDLISPQEAVLTRLHEDLGIPMDTLWGYLAENPDGTLVEPTYWRIIARNVPAYIALPLSEVRHVHLEARAQRHFPDPYLAPQVLGFVRGDAVWGLERQYRAEMAGEPGRVFRSFQTDGASLTVDVPARDGHLLVTTLDAGIQRIAQRAAENAARDFRAEFTAVIIMQPHTGEILAMAQWPSFPLDAPDDGSRFTDPSVANFWNDMSEEAQSAQWNRIWPNFAVGRSFEPGSTFKAFVMAAAIEEGAISPGMSHFYCEGVRQVADWAIPCHNIHGHGSLSFERALQVSCNIAMIDIMQALGRDNFYRYRNDFGFGSRTGIDLPAEEAVSAPGVMYTLNQLNAVEMATSSIGQGFNATAIQSINAFASLINGGYIMRPHVVSQIVDVQGNIIHENTPTVVRNVLSQQTSDIMREYMQSVVSPLGTGRRVVIDGYALGGKTGTGQQGHLRDWLVTSFIGYMPVENPQFLAMGIVYNPEDNQLAASASAAPMIREVLEGIIQYRQLPPAGTEQATGVLQDAGGEALPDFSGMELREITPILNSMGIDYQISGRGAVVSHHIPAAGQLMPRHTPIFLYLDGNIIDILDELTFMPSVEGLRTERAEELVLAAGLTPVVIYSGSIVRGYDETVEELTENRMIYEQFPSAGIHIQRGTQVRLREQRMD